MEVILNFFYLIVIVVVIVVVVVVVVMVVVVDVGMVVVVVIEKSDVRIDREQTENRQTTDKQTDKLLFR